MSNYLELKAKAEKLMQQVEEARRKEVAEVIGEIKKKMAIYEIAIDDLGITDNAKKTKAAKSYTPSTKSAPRYKGPAGETWSGKGRQPAWLKEAIGQGKTKQDFAL
ncbi:H-NS histone family protein [Pusillimonas sp. MFBS29]|uniref:H-NS histone family protein n=1 Tax=Pusillimonas sp. MFBS29 TaxID=2886690 RepID=UPI001D11B0F0|nr:H-NS histone family protein [Pusillimonas sp. MFBS29]MCC2597800.1 H-NS histone family protein [Pusillimonas sp. MFBS29]